MSSIVTLENISIYPSAGATEPVLKDVSFTLSAAEMAFLVGPVGSGKSSLLRTIYGDVSLRGTEGVATVCGFNLRKTSKRQLHKLRRSIGVVFQENYLLENMSVAGNLEFVLKATDWKNRKEISQRIGFVLDMVNMTDKAHKMPSQISGGERQKVAIARSLLNSPRLILADEPTADLDPVSATEVIELFRSIASDSDSCVLISTHNSENLRVSADRIMRCMDGYLELL